MRKVSIGKVMQKKNGQETGKIASWYYRFEKKERKPDGKRDFFYKAGFKTKNEAEKEGLKAFNVEYGIIPDPDKSKERMFYNMQFECYVMEHWFNSKTKRLAKTTLTGDRKRLKNYIFPYFGKKTLGQIDQELIQNFFDDMYLNSTLALSTTENLYSLMAQIFKFAFNNQHIFRNPMLNVAKPNFRIESTVKKNKQKRDTVPDEVIEKILERFPEGTSVHLIFNLCLHAGLRLGEACGLAWSDVSFDKHCLFISRQLQRNSSKQLLSAREEELIKKNPCLKNFGWYTANPKYNSKRIIPMTPELEELLKREYEKQQFYRKMLGKKYKEYYYTKTDKPHITTDFEEFNSVKETFENGIVNTEGIGYKIDFVNRREDGKLVTESVVQHLGRIVHGKEKEPAIYEDFNIHSLRHTFSSRLRAKGYQEHIIQSLMGHKSSVETKTYMHITENEFNAALTKITGQQSAVSDIMKALQTLNLSEEKLQQLSTILNDVDS